MTDKPTTRPPSDATDAQSEQARPPSGVAVLLQNLFAIKRGDREVLKLIAPLFGVVTSSSVVIATFTRAVFLSDHETKTLPLMFLGSSIFTALLSIGYVSVIEKFALTRRFIALLVIAQASFATLHLLYPLHPKAIALVQLIWCTGLSNLILVQTWNMTSALVPARQGKRLFPVLAAVSTLGAALGGAMVGLLLKVVEARYLLWLALLLLFYPLMQVGKIIRKLTDASMDAADSPLPVPMLSRGPTAAAKRGPDSEIVRGFQNILESPLLLRLAGLVFLLQVASLILDFQFSSELKRHYSRDQLASFLGIYYGSANLVAFFVALLATNRIVRVLGIGVSISASAIFVAVGSLAYFFAATLGWGSVFWSIAAAAFFERIGQFALTRNAMQILVMPVETRKGERAKTLIDGVVYRVATALVSIVLLALAPAADRLGYLAPFTILACIGAVFIGLSMAPHYRRALFEGLRARRVDSEADAQTRGLMVRAALGEVRQRLASDSSRDILQSIDMIQEMKLPIDANDLLPIARKADPDLARAALEAMNNLGLKPDRALLLELLTADKPPALLREVLRLLGQYPDKALLPLVAQFVQHPDLGVARLAVVWSKQVGSDDVTEKFTKELMADLRSSVEERRVRAAFISGGYALDDGSHLAHMLDDPSPQVRMNAVQSMGQIGSPEFIEPLIKALGKADLVPAGSSALQRYGSDLISVVANIFRVRPPSSPIQLRLLRIIERFSSAEAVSFLMDQTDRAPDSVVRNNAIQSLWRMAREADAPKPPRAWSKSHVLSEIDKLRRYATIEQLVPPASTRHAFFLAELQTLRLQAEQRAFRLLGLLLSRAAMHRAYLHYRSPAQRVRSNAIELLDQHVIDPELKTIVALVERSEGTTTGVFAINDDVPASGAVETSRGLNTLLLQVEPWLNRVWQWAQEQSGGKVARDPMDMVFLLKGVPLFSDLSGEQLLPLTDIVQNVHVEAGEMVFAEGEPGNHLYVILEGTVDVLRGGDSVALLNVKECFGEMALLDQSPRSASCRAKKNVELLAIARDDFQDLLDLHPALARGVIRVLTQRLRVATEQVAEERN